MDKKSISKTLCVKIFDDCVREKLGGVPFEVSHDGKNTVLRFFPKSSTAKNPDGIVFMLALDKDDKKKLAEIIS